MNGGKGERQKKARAQVIKPGIKPKGDPHANNKMDPSNWNTKG